MRREKSRCWLGPGAPAVARGSGAFRSALWWAPAARRPGGRSAGDRRHLAARRTIRTGPRVPRLRSGYTRRPRPRASPGPCPSQLFARGSTRGPISRRPFPGYDGRGGPRCHCRGGGGGGGRRAKPRPGSSARAALRLHAATARGPRAEAREWLARFPRSAAYQVGDAPSLGLSSRGFKTRARRGLRRKFTQLESLEIAGPDWPDAGVGSERGGQGRRDGHAGSTPGPPGGAATVSAHPGPEAAQGVCLCARVDRVECGSCVHACLVRTLQLPGKVAGALGADVH